MMGKDIEHTYKAKGGRGIKSQYLPLTRVNRKGPDGNKKEISIHFPTGDENISVVMNTKQNHIPYKPKLQATDQKNLC